MSEHELRLDQIIGRELLGGNNQPIGLIEDVRTDPQGNIVDVAIGMTGLLERLDLGARMLIGASKEPRVAGWNQIDFSNPSKPKLIVAIDQLVRP